MRRDLNRLIVVVAAVALLAPTYVWAQATSGSIRGTVTDPEGGVMPGATVVAFSDKLVAGQQVSIASGNGTYRFPSLPPGDYVLEAQLAGFKTVRRENLTLKLGQTLEVDLQLGDPEFAEEIVVVADTVQLSTVSNTVAHNMGEDFIERQPLLRDPTNLMNYAPGINDDQAYGAPSTYQNAYNLDGVDVSDPALGSQWILPSMDWIEEVQVTGLGADAEYGGFTGAVVNLITKSGGNEFHGDVRAYYSGGSLNSDNAPEGVEGTNTLDTDLDVSASLGGPVIRDSLWYFVSANQRQRDIEPFFAAGAPTDDRATSDRTETRAIAKLTWQANDSNKVMFLFDWDDVAHDHRGVGDLTLASAAEEQESPNYSYNISWEGLINDQNFAVVKVTGFTGSDDRLPYFGDTPGRGDFDSGFDWQNRSFTDTKDVDRLAVDASWNLFVDGLFADDDSHNFKFGVLYETLDDHEVGTRNGGFTYYDDSYYCSDLDEYFADPFCGVYSSDRGGEYDIDASMDGLHFFAQDSWKIGRIAINAGLRYTRYQGEFNNPVSAPSNGESKPYDVDMIAPRIGFVWDLFGNGSTAFKAHYGQYYEGLAVTFFDRELSGDAFQDTEYWDYNFDTGAFDIPVGGAKGERARMDPGIKHPYVEQYVATLERQVGNDMLVGVDYIRRENKDISAMVTANVGDYDALVAPDNPLGGGNLPFFELLEEPDFLLTNPDAAKRTYDSVALRFGKRYRDGWALDASLVWADSTGNADYALSGYVTDFEDLNGLVNADGTLPYNSEWVLKVSGSVDLPWGFMLSGFYQYRTGEYWTPYVRIRGLLENDRTTVFMTPRGSEQYEDRDTLDLSLEKAFRFGDALELALRVDVFNVFDSDEVTGVVQRWGDYLYQWDAHPEESEWRSSSSYKTPTAIQTPRQIRFGARFSF